VLVDPRDVPAIAAAIADLLADPDRRASLAAAGRQRAGGFSWERTATVTRDVLRALA
jgi:glycosyltransferase involved in cell wall biosynthesis